MKIIIKGIFFVIDNKIYKILSSELTKKCTRPMGGKAQNFTKPI